MQRSPFGLALVLALIIAGGVALAATPPHSFGAVPVHASAPSFSLNYSDPAGDVFEMWTSNNSHVTDASGNWLMFGTPLSVDLKNVASNDLGSSVQLLLKVRDAPAVLPNTTYEYRLYTRLDNATHFIVTFHDGITTMVTNHTGSQVWNLTAKTVIGGTTSLGWLGVDVDKAYLGGIANITKWDMDAQTKMVGKNYTFEDYVWSLPGNPGSAPAFIQGRVTDVANGAGLANANVSAGSGGYFTTTNATGYYSLPAAPGTFTLTYTLAGYETATRQVTVNNQQTATVNVALSKSGGFPWIWIILAVIVLAAVLVAFLVLRRRKPAPPK